MTKLLYLEDMYNISFEAKITKINEDGSILLDQTLFYPGGGGQPHDQGTMDIGGIRYQVIKVKKNGKDVFHYFENPSSALEMGTHIKGKINWDLRHKHSRTHTAMHILCGVIYSVYSSVVTGGDFGALKGRMDFDIDTFKKERLEFIEKECNIAIKKAFPIKIEFLSREEADKIPELIRTKVNLIPKSVKTIRTVDIVGLDKQADGGTHVKNTKEVGRIKIIKADNKGKGRRRIYLEILDS